MQKKEFVLQAKALGLNLRQNVVIAPYTTFRIGGVADILIVVNETSELHSSVLLCQKYGFNYKILGGGSNILVSDAGFRGVLIVNKSKGIDILDATSQNIKKNTDTAIRYDSHDLPNTVKKRGEPVIVRIASGVKVPKLMNTLFVKNISGLELFAGIPATVGGAIYMNMHGAHLFFGDLLLKADLLSHGEIKTVSHGYFEFDYDYSILHKTKETILSCDLLLNRGNASEAKEVAREWLKKKRIQPQRSAGCIFQNITTTMQQKLGLPSPSTGYIIDKILQMKGFTVGGARISESHAAFIENIGGATANDVLQLIAKVKEEALNKMALQLDAEIEYIE